VRSDKERLLDILGGINNIEKYLKNNQERFFEDELIQVWVVHHLQIIGEAANNLSDDLINQYDYIPWAKIIAFRNIILHEYFRVDLQVMNKIIRENLKELKRQIKEII
jgi:uncharacterized protein with HEPN domain